MIQALLTEGVVGRAVTSGLIRLGVHDLRDFTDDRHRTVDDMPYGGGPGMVLKPEPFFLAVAAIRREHGEPDVVALMSPQGRVFRHEQASTLSGRGHVVLLCGRYEGVDERVRLALVTEEISIGDYVLSGGELAAAVVVDTVARLVPGVVGDAESVEQESFVDGLLDHPHYTRPAVFDGREVPEVLRSGHHVEIQRWRRREALRRTQARRPDLLGQAPLDAQARRWSSELKDEASRSSDREQADECD